MLHAKVQRRVSAAWNDAFIGPAAPFSLSEFCANSGIPRRTADNWCADLAPAPAWATSLAFEWMTAKDPQLALVFLASAFDLLGAGVALVRLPRSRAGEGLTVDAMQLVAAVGELSAVAAECAADGTYDHVDGARIAQVISRRVLPEALEVHADARAIPSPQQPLSI